MQTVNVFAGGTLDRLGHLRADEAWLAARLTDPGSRFLATWRGMYLVAGDDAPRPVLLAPEDVAPLAGEITVLLGSDGDTMHFAVELGAEGDDPAAGPLAGRGEFRELRGVAGLMPAHDASLLAYARGLLYWHTRHRFCGVCGSPTEIRQAGHMRRCTDAACATDHFPRTDPAVIMVVGDGDRCLLGRQKSWPEGLYSSLAGFVEPGESLEEAVAREVLEESGIVVRNVRYHSSQPWPFPGSVMLGFFAEAATTDISVRYDELEDARWFHRRELENPAGTLRLPRSESIARRLVDDWISGSIP